jgi:hypothetical protein
MATQNNDNVNKTPPPPFDTHSHPVANLSLFVYVVC